MQSPAGGRLAVLARQLAAGGEPSSETAGGLATQHARAEAEQRPAPGGGKGTLSVIDNRTGRKYTVRRRAGGRASLAKCLAPTLHVPPGPAPRARAGRRRAARSARGGPPRPPRPPAAAGREGAGAGGGRCAAERDADAAARPPLLCLLPPPPRSWKSARAAPSTPPR